MITAISFVIRSLIFLAILVVLAMNISIAKVLPYANLVDKYASQYQVDSALVHAVIKQESNYNTLAVSHAGAQGLMQLMPATAERFGVTNSYIPEQNIKAGTKYLSWLLKRFKGNTRFALAGYNAGEGKVDRYHGIPPYKETQNYVVRVMTNYQAVATIATSHKNLSKPKLSTKKPVYKRVEKSAHKTIHISGSSRRIHSHSLTRISSGSTRISHSVGHRS